jgi:hypothetical protein
MRLLTLLAASMLLSLMIGCGPPPPDTTGVPPPKSPEETQKDIEKAMKEKGISPKTYGK